MLGEGDQKWRRRWLLLGALVLLLTGIILVRRANNKLDEFGACVAGADAVKVYAANGDTERANKAVIIFVTVPTPTGGYDLSEHDAVSSNIVRVTYATGGKARSRICNDVSEGSIGDTATYAVSGHVIAEAESDPGSDKLFSRVRVEASDLVFENGHEIDEIEIDWVEVGWMPGS